MYEQIRREIEADKLKMENEQFQDRWCGLTKGRVNAHTFDKRLRNHLHVASLLGRSEQATSDRFVRQVEAYPEQSQ